MHSSIPDLNAIVESAYEKLKALNPDIPDGRGLYEVKDFRVFVFPQAWGSTSLGRGGIGGQCMTEATTVVVIYGESAYVWVGIEYIVKKFNNKFMNDVRSMHMLAFKDSSRYEMALNQCENCLYSQHSNPCYRNPTISGKVVHCENYDKWKPREE